MTQDFKWKILEVLMQSKKPMRAHHIAQALDTTQSQVEYHLRPMIDESLVICFNDHGAKRYGCQLLLQSKKVEDDFYAVIAGAIDNLLCYMDLSQGSDMTEGFMNNITALLRKLQRNLEKSIKNSQKL